MLLLHLHGFPTRALFLTRMSQRLITGQPDCECCNCPDALVFNTNTIGGGGLLQGNGPPYGQAGFDPPPDPAVPWKYDDIVTDVTYTWIVANQAWNG